MGQTVRSLRSGGSTNVASMVASPEVRARTIPFDEIVATLGVSDFQVTGYSCNASLASAIAVTWRESPTSSVGESGRIQTYQTLTARGHTFVGAFAETDPLVAVISTTPGCSPVTSPLVDTRLRPPVHSTTT